MTDNEHIFGKAIVKYTVGKMNIETVTIFLSNYISKGVIDIKLKC